MENILDDNSLKSKKETDYSLYASFGNRTAASILDMLVLIPIYILIGYNYQVWKILSVDILLNISPFFYKIIMEWKFGATVGKMAIKLRVVDYNLQKISLLSSSKRFSTYFFAYLPNIIFSYYLFNQEVFYTLSSEELDSLILTYDSYWINLTLSFVIWIGTCGVVLFSKKKQAAHDLIAKTYCVKLKELKNFKEVDLKLHHKNAN
ncbi:MAG: RDD family protein [Aureispira sp.]|nr:RDD family protein [Aureispira sp.]